MIAVAVQKKRARRQVIQLSPLGRAAENGARGVIRGAGRLHFDRFDVISSRIFCVIQQRVGGSNQRLPRNCLALGRKFYTRHAKAGRYSNLLIRSRTDVHPDLDSFSALASDDSSPNNCTG